MGRLGQREGRLVELHGQGGLASSPTPSPTPSAAASTTAPSPFPNSRPSATRRSPPSAASSIIGCGTAAYAGIVAKYAIEKWAGIPVEVELSHEFRYRDPVITDDTLVISISPVRRDHGHAHGRQVRQRTRRQDALRSATHRVRRFPASRMPSSTRTPDPRSRSPRPRPSSPRSPRSTSSACTSPACAAR